jgi:hypothetical protein
MPRKSLRADPFHRVYCADGIVWIRGNHHGSDVSLESAESMSLDELADTLAMGQCSARDALNRADKMRDELIALESE